MVRVRRKLAEPGLGDPLGAARSELRAIGLERWVKPGQRIAVGCGSRGIACYAQIVKGALAALQEAGAQPFIVPAMGSHGGATAEGQLAVLAAAGITTESMGVPVVASMDVVEVGQIPGGPTVFFDRHAAAADGIMPINRVKPHTDFRSDLASGLLKMLVIGFGKERGANSIHRYGVRGLKHFIPQAAELILQRMPVIPGLAIVENALDQPAMLRALVPEGMMEGERELLSIARNNMAGLPVTELDVLVLDEMGKDISGAGLDPNVIGRMYITGEEEFTSPRINRIVVLDLTPASHGNAVGWGLADFITERLCAKADKHATYLNAITASFVERGRMPIPLPNDRQAIETALLCAWQPDHLRARIVRAKNTLELGEVYVSTAVWDELKGQSGVQQLSDPLPWQFSPAGELCMPW